MSIATKVIGILRGVFGISVSGGAPTWTSAGAWTLTVASGSVLINYPDGQTVTLAAVGSGSKVRFFFSTIDAAVVDVNGYRVAANRGYYFSNGTDNADTTLDAGIVRVAANVVKPSDGTNDGWLQQAAGTKRLTAAVTNATTTFANLADLTVTLIAGRKYTGRLVLPINESTAADGAKFDLNGGTATMTSIEFGVSAALGATIGVRTSTALATALTLTALADTSDVWVEIPITLVCNAAGTLIPRQAQNAHSTGTLTLRVGGYLQLDDCPN